MSDPVLALDGAAYEGYISVAEAPLQGMITLRSDLSAEKLKTALKSVLGLAVPKPRAVLENEEHSAAWMAPDELLLFVPYDRVEGVVVQLLEGLGHVHSLVVNVSDAQAVFTLQGGALREVIAKLAPVNSAPGQIEPGELRRTRFGQCAAAFWLLSDDAAKIICFRSVARYMFDQLKAAATPGHEVGIWS